MTTPSRYPASKVDIDLANVIVARWAEAGRQFVSSNAAKIAVATLIDLGWKPPAEPVMDAKTRWELERAVRINLMTQVILAHDSSLSLIYGTTPLTWEQAQAEAERAVDAVNGIPKQLDNGGA